MHGRLCISQQPVVGRHGAVLLLQTQDYKLGGLIMRGQAEE